MPLCINAATKKVATDSIWPNCWWAAVISWKLWLRPNLVLLWQRLQQWQIMRQIWTLTRSLPDLSGVSVVICRNLNTAADNETPSPDGMRIGKKRLYLFWCFRSNILGIIFDHLFLWMMALKARPSRHDWVKSWTLTPGYLWVVFWAHRRSASFADRSSWPTTMSEIWKRKEKQSVYWSHLLVMRELQKI